MVLTITPIIIKTKIIRIINFPTLKLLKKLFNAIIITAITIPIISKVRPQPPIANLPST